MYYSLFQQKEMFFSAGPRLQDSAAALGHTVGAWTVSSSVAAE